jgi:hypothetical protein
MATKQTSVNVQPVKGGSEEHNKREKQLDYVRKDLSHLNQYWESDTQANRLANIKALYQSKTGQKMQAKATPIREGVVVIQESTTMADLHRLADAYRDRLGIEVFQIAIHRDEGYQKSKDWKPNLHAHLVFDWTNHSTGKSVKLNRQKMAEMQTITAEVLGMERGQSSEKKHLTAQQFKAAAEAQRAEQLKEQVAELSTAKAAKEETINTIKTVGKYVVDAVTGKAKAKENALQERVTKLEVQLPTEREKGRQEGGKQVLQAILSAARLKLEDLTPENIGKRWRLWFDKAKSLEQEVKQLKEAAEAKNKALQDKILMHGREQYREGMKTAQTRIKGLEEDVAELIREYAHGDPDVILHYSTPREDRLFLSPKELERQEERKRREQQEGKKKAPRLAEAPKQERREEEQRSRGFRR